MIIEICDRAVHVVPAGLRTDAPLWVASIRTDRDEAVPKPSDVIFGMGEESGVHGFVLDPDVSGGGLRYVVAVGASAESCINAARDTLQANNQPFIALLRAERDNLYDDPMYVNRRGDRPRRFEAIRAGRYLVSVQASEGHHCYPRLTTNDLGKYLLWEVSTSWPLDVPSVHTFGCADPYLNDLQRKLDREEAGWIPTHVVQKYLDYLAALPDGPELSP